MKVVFRGALNLFFEIYVILLNLDILLYYEIILNDVHNFKKDDHGIQKWKLLCFLCC